MPSLPTVGGSTGTWGTELNNWLGVGHNTDGSVKQPFFNVKDPAYGAAGNGSSDDTAAIQAALTAARLAGGGLVLIPDGTYLISSTQTSAGCLAVGGDNITIFFTPGAKLVVTTTNQGAFNIHGAIKAGAGSYSGAKWYEFQGVIPIAAASMDAMTITASSSADITSLGLVAGDYICVRTGQTIGGQTHLNPDSELLKVTGIVGAAISVDRPLGKDYAQEYFQTTNTPTTLTAQANPGDTSITVASISGYGNGDRITIGNVGGMMQMNQVNGTPSGNTIPLFAPITTGITIPNGAVVHRGAGVTTTSVTGAPAAMGIAKVTAMTISNVNVVNPRIDQTGNNGGAGSLEQVDGFRMLNGNISTYAGTIVNANNVRDVLVEGNVVHHIASNTVASTWGIGRGSSNLKFRSNQITSEAHAGIAMSEGTTGWSIIDNTIIQAPQAVPGRQLIAVQTRAGKGIIADNILVGGPTDYPVGIESSAGSGTRGGIIDRNWISTAATNGCYIKVSGWTYGRGNRSNAPARSDSTSSPLFISGTGSPETVYTAPIGSEYVRYDGGANTTHYFKESGTGATGWVGK